MNPPKFDRPFHLLIPGGILLALLIAVVQVQEMERSPARSLLPPQLGEMRHLLIPPMDEEAMRHRGREHLQALGVDTTGYLSSVGLFFDRENFTAAGKRSPDEQDKFVQLGAPFVLWTVTFFEPHKAVEHRESYWLYIDSQGRLAGTGKRLYEPESIRLPQSDEDWKTSIARWSTLDVNRLSPAARSDLLGSGHERADVAWTLDGAVLDELRVVVSARHRHGFLNWERRILPPVDLSYLSELRTGKGFAYWTAILLAVPLAFVVGSRWEKSSPIMFQKPLKFVLLAGLGTACLMAVIQAVALAGTGHMISIAIACGFVVGILFFLGLGVALARSDLQSSAMNSVTKPVRVAYVSAVPVAYIVMSFSCSGNLYTGCSDVCSIVRMSVMPLSLLALFVGHTDRRFYAYAVTLCLAGLMPHCICDNFVNHPWIAAIGVSPMCYYFPFCVCLVAVHGLIGVYPRICLGASVGSTAVVGALGAGHQLFSWPW